MPARRRLVRKLTHLDSHGLPTMVDVSAKSITERTAVAESRVRLTPAIRRLIGSTGRRRGRKGDAISVAVLAGIQGAKRTPDIIPLCHPVRIASVCVEPTVSGLYVTFRVTCVAMDRTGVEMEAMVSAAAAALAFYDMVKSADRGVVIERIRLLKKTGGESGVFVAG